jgi:Ser/Thr protein kinase RdoA (MazF antagonist)
MYTVEFEIAKKFKIRGEILSSKPFGSGHINTTRIITTDKAQYVMQKINKNVFHDPEGLMDNYCKVTRYLYSYIEKNGGDPERETLNVINAIDGRPYAIDSEGDYWRMLTFIKDSVSYDKVETPYQFYESAVTFGSFMNMLRDFPAETLVETIPNFHNTPDRMRKLMDACELDRVGRRAGIKAEIDFALARLDFSNMLEDAHKEGKLPLRVTHNDTKLNNILFDKNTLSPICVCDLDTIMPGYSVNDFGDSIRFGATTALEDETDLSKVNFDIELYELYVKGFIEGASGGLTEGELEMLPYSAIMMTLECGVRFLTDYLLGDTYFRIHRENHNLDRARNQFKLVSDMEKALPEMIKIVQKYSK